MIAFTEALGKLARIEDFLCKTTGVKQGIEENLSALVAENAALRADKERLDRLERELLYNARWPLINIEMASTMDGILLVEQLPSDAAENEGRVLERTLRGALDKAFAHLDDARKGGS